MRFFLLKKCILLVFCAIFALKCFSSTSVNQTKRSLDRWEALSSSHFTIYFTQEHKNWATRALDEAEQVRSLVLSKVGQALDKKVNIFVVDPYKGSNGYALPDMDQPSIVLFVTPPQSDSHLGQGISWERLSVLHEYIHLIHLSEKYTDTWKNHLDEWVEAEEKAQFSVPEWIAEGYAIHMESKLTQKGRLENVFMKALFDEYVVKGALPSYQSLNLPAENAQSQKILYMTSGLFFTWLEEKVGSKNFDAFWEKWRLDKVSSFEEIFKDFFGKRAEAYYQQFIALTTYSVLANKNSDLAEKNLPSVMHEFLEEIESPILSQDKKRLSIIENVTEGHRVKKQISIYEIVYTSAGGSRELRKVASQDQLDHAKIFSVDWLDDNILLYSASDQSVGGTFTENLYAWDIRQNKVLVVKENSQIRRLDVSEDKKYIVAEKMQNGLSQLVIFKIADLDEEIALMQGGEGQRYDFPKLNKSGDQVVYLESVGGNHWQLMIYEFAKNTQYPLPTPKGLEYLSQPHWSDDGSGVYFIGGIKRQVNLYHYSFKNQRVEQKTQGFAPVSWPLLFDASDIAYFASFPEGDLLLSDKLLVVRQPSPQALASHIDGFEKTVLSHPGAQSAKAGNLQSLMYESRQMQNAPGQRAVVSNDQQQTMPQYRVNQPQQTLNAKPQTRTYGYRTETVVQQPSSQPMNQPMNQQPHNAQAQNLQPYSQPTYSQPTQSLPEQPSYQVQREQQKGYASEAEVMPPTGQQEKGGASQQIFEKTATDTHGSGYAYQDNSHRSASENPQVRAQPEEKLNAKERAYKRFSKRAKTEDSSEIDSFLNAIIEGPEPSQSNEPPSGQSAVQNGPRERRYRQSPDYLNQAPIMGNEAINRSMAFNQTYKPVRQVTEDKIAQFISSKQHQDHTDPLKTSASAGGDIDAFFKSKKTIAKLAKPKVPSSGALDDFFDAKKEQSVRVARLNASNPIIGLMPLPEMQPWFKKPLPEYDPIVSRFPPFDFMAQASAAGGVIGNNCWKNAGKQYDIDPWLLFSLGQKRSGLEPNLISGSENNRHLGIMQVPENYLPMLQKYGIDETQLLDPCTNIHVVAWGINQQKQPTGNTWEAVARFFIPEKEYIANAMHTFGEQYYSHYELTMVNLMDTEATIARNDSQNFLLGGEKNNAIFFLDSTLNWAQSQPLTVKAIKNKPSATKTDKAIDVLDKLNAMAKENNLQSQNMVYKICSSFKKTKYANKEAAIDDLFNAEIELINLRRKKFLTENEFKSLRSWMSETRDLFSLLSSRRLEDELLPSQFCES